jgi:hypothetical protein
MKLLGLTCGKRIHFYEIQDVSKALATKRDQIPPKLEQYKAYKRDIKPPKKVAKKS